MKLCLADVTLLAVTSVDIEQTHHALIHSAQHIDFGAIKLLSPTPPKQTDSPVTHIAIPPIDFYGYSRFIFHSLHEHVSTRHCLIIQADGFVLNPQCWLPEYTDYDYIGAPWPEFIYLHPSNERIHLNRNRVGNGGFSLRSKRLLQITSQIDFDQLSCPVPSEDFAICHHLYDQLCSLGIRFAPLDLAARFSIESPTQAATQPIEATFGFHGKHWLEALGDALPTALQWLEQSKKNNSDRVHCNDNANDNVNVNVSTESFPEADADVWELVQELRAINILVHLGEKDKPVNIEEYGQLKQLTMALINSRNSGRICLLVGSAHHDIDEISIILTQVMFDCLASSSALDAACPPNLIPAPASGSGLEQLRPHLACEMPLQQVNIDAIQRITTQLPQQAHPS